MSSVRLELRNKTNKAGEKPIAIRITINRRSTYRHTGYYVREKQWNAASQLVRKNHPNHNNLNRLLNKLVSEARDELLELHRTNPDASLASMKRGKSKMNRLRFFELADQYLENLEKSGKHNRHSADKPRIKHFKKFLGNQEIDWSQLTESSLRQFQAWLKAERNVSDRTIANHMVVIRTIYNLAIREGYATKSGYPFGRGRLVIKFPETEKVGLNRSELETLEQIKLHSKPQRHALNVWLFSFYCAGIRVSDVLRLRWSAIKDGRLYYQMKKNGKALSIKLPNKALGILDQYERLLQSDFIFPELAETPDDETEVQKAIKNAVKKFNTHLVKVAIAASIEKPLSMHISRHTFGRLAGDQIPIHILQRLYRHSSVTTTVGYQSNFILDELDESIDKVVGSS